MGAYTRTITGLTGLIATVVLGTGSGPFGTTAAGAIAPASTYQAAATFTGPITTGSVIEPLSANPLQLVANGYVQQEFFRGGERHCVHGQVRTKQRAVEHRARHHGLLPDPDLGPAAEEPGSFQRQRGGRVDERLGRRVGSGLGLPQSGS